MSAQPESPQDSTTTRLYLALGRLNRALRRDAKDATIGHGGLSALATLIEQGPQRAGTLAETEGITAPAMTRIVNSLVELGYVERTPDPADGRAQLVAPTTSGTALVLDKRAVRLRALQERLDRLSEDERAAVTTALAALENLTSEMS
ncbi:MarR family winged helix-turn-helix transcriptional regulator [Nocardioides marmorisolisilvae]|uniref:MarR family transcriptional regulator n=1 Tax=Nocardioides marmorisolisilvae TaxID=1542737 RepID=A0A3N0DT95_9ACTN|nr:MarR family transcriptional regulator [Nocardioides marmorisolisilvae]RNL78810.1 MarR family transcriptional regulator [Nocardioides marmorisolisilvae]